jgi:hypothetical protein
VQLDAGVGKVVTWFELVDYRSKMEGWSQALYDLGPEILTL